MHEYHYENGCRCAYLDISEAFDRKELEDAAREAEWELRNPWCSYGEQIAWCQGYAQTIREYLEEDNEPS